MERLWAPWRMQYIEVKEEGCVFCTKQGSDDPKHDLVLYRGESCFLLMNLFPYNNGHLLIAPYRHTADFPGLTGEEQAEMMRLAAFSTNLLGEAFKPDGFNMGMNLGRTAGAGVADHLHLHVVPRWDGDSNFMPVVAGTKVLPDALFTSYERLMAAAEKIGWPGQAQRG